MLKNKLWVRYAVSGIIGVIGMAAALFLAAGRLDWAGAWGALAVMAVWTIAMIVIMGWVQPGLLEQRMGANREKNSADTVMVSLINLASFIRYIVAGLDIRNGWSGAFPSGAQIAALIICFLGYDLLFIWAISSNGFFTQIVRVQPERGQTVVSGGPYRFVRHPGYAGVILFELAVCILLGSWWALVASAVSVMVIVIRTALEDHLLQAKLAGYAEYAQRVRYRLLPGIW
jgi:protein-S-isoprenylcysteine O-methyltransferase Ste14